MFSKGDQHFSRNLTEVKRLLKSISTTPPHLFSLGYQHRGLYLFSAIQTTDNQFPIFKYQFSGVANLADSSILVPKFVAMAPEVVAT